MTITAAHAPTPDLTARPLASQGLIRPRLMAFELRRLLRNRRTLIFSVIFPVVLFLMVSMQMSSGDTTLGPGVVADAGAYVMVSMAVYAAITAATAAGAAVAVERSAGWSRRLRITPLRPGAAILAKTVAAFAMGVIGVGAVFFTGAVTGRAHMGAQAWGATFAIIVMGALVFGAFGLFLGYLLPSDNVMALLGPIIALLAVFGGLFSGPIDPHSSFGQIAQFTPIYGLSMIAHWPLTLTHAGTYATFDWGWVDSLTIWGLLFVAGAVRRFRQDTARG